MVTSRAHALTDLNQSAHEQRCGKTSRISEVAFDNAGL